jgi:hypothetical protein
MSLESVGVLKLQANLGQVRLPSAKRQRLYRRRFGGARSVLSTGGASGSMEPCRAARQEVCISGHEGNSHALGQRLNPSSCTSTPAAEAF